MRVLGNLLYWLAWWSFRPMIWWVRYRAAPDKLTEELSLDPDKPVCYVVPARSWADRFVLERVCEDKGLPAVHRGRLDLPTLDRPGFLYLPALDANQGDFGSLEALMKQALDDDAYDVQMVPVSVFWGRDPGKETSLLRIMFSDSVTAGALRKFFIMLANGREVFVNFGKPLEFREFMGRNRAPQSAMRKLARVFNVHFLRSRTAVLGPSLLRRQVLIRGLLNTPAVRAAIEAEAKQEAKTIEKVRVRARKCAEEIAADYSSAAINFLERVLSYVWNKVYAGIDVNGMERLRETAQSHEMVYVPSHRSHADYLLISYVLYHGGLVPPHIAAGVNLNMPVVGALLRRCGAFFMRRKFAGDKLYTAIFRAYVDSLIHRGYSISFYPEGGRSRTGRLLQPKAGLMAMVAESALRQRSRKVALVPVYIGYDKVWEINSYLKELRGAQKKGESVQGLIKATRILGKNYGKPYVNFGEPIRLQDFADQHLPGWQQQMGTEAEQSRPPGFAEAIDKLAAECMRRINGAAVAGPVALTSAALLSSPRKAVGEAELINQLDYLIRLLKAEPYSADICVPRTDARDVLDWSAAIAGLSRIEHDWGNVIVAEERPAVAMTYYRNNIQHLLAVPSLIAIYFRTRYQVEEDIVVQGSVAMYRFLRSELYLRWDPEDCEAIIRRWVDLFCEHGLLTREGTVLHRPSANEPTFGVLGMLARVLGESLERYCMTILLLDRSRRENEGIDPDAFIGDCGKLAERLAILTGRNAPEFFEKSLFRGYLDTLVASGAVHRDADGKLVPGDHVGTLAERALELLSSDAQQTILQTITRRPGAD